MKIILLSAFLFSSFYLHAQDTFDDFEEKHNVAVSEQHFEKALEIAKQMVSLVLGHEGDTGIHYAVSLRYVADDYSSLRKKDSSIHYYQIALGKFHDAGKQDHGECGHAIYNLGLLYHRSGDYKLAEPLYLSAMKLYTSYYGENSIFVSMCYNGLGVLYSDLGDYSSAKINYQKAIGITEKKFGKENAEYANNINNLGSVYFEEADYANAEKYFREAMEIRIRVYNEHHPQVAASMDNLALVYKAMGDFKSAEPFCKQALEIRKKELGEMNEDYARSLNNLASLYRSVGDYKLAEPLFIEALKIRKQVLGESHPDYSGSLNNLGILYSDMGDFKTAEAYYRQAMNVRRETLGESHPLYASSMLNLGILYYEMGDYDLSEPLYKQALVIVEKVNGKNHPDYAMLIDCLGRLYEALGDYKQAEPFYLQAIDIRSKTIGENHPDYAMSINNLAYVYMDMGEYLKAEYYFKKDLGIKRITIGEDHPDYSRTLNNLAYLYFKMGNHDSAMVKYKEAYVLKTKKLMTNFAWLTTREKDAYWSTIKIFYAELNFFAAKTNSSLPITSCLSYNACLVAKSLLLASSRDLYNAIAQRRDSMLEYEFKLLKTLRQQYSKMQSDPSIEHTQMDQMKEKADSLEKKLVNAVGEYASYRRKFEITWKDVRNSLAKDEVAIEFSRFYDEIDSVNRYIALVVRSNYDYPHLVELCDEYDLLDGMETKDYSYLYDLVWKPIDRLLTGVKTVYYSPVGQLDHLPFSALCMKEGSVQKVKKQKDKRGVDIESEDADTWICDSYLMDKYTLHQLTTTRNIADGTLKKERLLHKSIDLMGGINYDETPIANGYKKINQLEYEQGLAMKLKNLEEDSYRLGGGNQKMPFLNGTLVEVNSVEKILAPAHWNVNVRKGAEADEYDWKGDMLRKSPAVLHVATHGFAFPFQEKKGNKSFSSEKNTSYKTADNPMVRCGLMLSGSNISWMGNQKKMIEKTGDDGILTAAEVSDLDLSETKLVVLSACETGLGKIEGSEGTFGLKRGFKLAGVEQLIVSLWSVPDKETMELMTLFYNDLSKTLNPVISFQHAQKTMRNKYPNEPEKWAGFVLIR